MSVDPTQLRSGQLIRHTNGDEYVLLERKAGADAIPFPGWWLGKLEPPTRCGLADGNWGSGEWALVGGQPTEPTEADPQLEWPEGVVGPEAVAAVADAGPKSVKLVAKSHELLRQLAAQNAALYNQAAIWCMEAEHEVKELRALPDQVLWEGETNPSGDGNRGISSLPSRVVVPRPPGTRVRVVAVPTGDPEGAGDGD